MRIAEIRFTHQGGQGHELFQFDGTTPDYEQKVFKRVLNHEHDKDIVCQLERNGFTGISNIDIKEVDL